MEIELYGNAVKDFAFWKKSGDVAIQKKIKQLFAATAANPFEGIGKPEQLKYDLSGKWSGGSMKSIVWFMKLVTMQSKFIR